MIDPLLSALGWDISDPDQVLAEFPIPKGRVDYAMFSDNSLCLVIEAKKLGHRLSVVDDDLVDQPLNYCRRVGCDHFVLTNGDKWEGFDVRAPGKLIDNRVFDFSVTGHRHNGHNRVMELLWLWPGNFRGKPARLKVPKPYLIDAPEPIPSQNETTGNPNAASSNPVRLRSGPTLASFKDYKGGSKPPMCLIFPDGQTKKLSNQWQNMQVETVKWLVETKKLRASMCPLKNEHKTLLVSNDEESFAEATPSSRPRQVGGLWINTKLGSENHVKRARGILKQCGEDPAQVGVLP